jgi:hypothetical protein
LPGGQRAFAPIAAETKPNTTRRAVDALCRRQVTANIYPELKKGNASCLVQSMTFCLSARPARRSTKLSGITFDRRPSRFARYANKTFQLRRMTTGLLTSGRALDSSRLGSNARRSQKA